MIRLVKKILFSIVLIVILLHTVIPHNQYIKINSSEQFISFQKDKTIIDIFRLIFLEDTNGNLDNLSINNPTSDYIFDFIVVNCYLIDHSYYISFEKEILKTPFFEEFSIYNKDFIVNHNGLRGPPRLI